MTENKRFTVKQRQGATIYSIIDYYGELPLSEGMYYKSNAEKLCKWLNTQHELLNAFYKENKQLKQYIYDNLDKDICDVCSYQYLEKSKMDKYYIAKCKKGYDNCSKGTVIHCEDFKFKELQE